MSLRVSSSSCEMPICPRNFQFLRPRQGLTLLALLSSLQSPVLGGPAPGRSGEDDLELQQVITRWERIPTVMLRVRTEPSIGNVPKDAGEAIWNPSNWERTALNQEADVTVRIRGEDLFLDYSFARDNMPRFCQMSLVAGEFIDVYTTAGKAHASAHVLTKRTNNRLGTDFMLLALEHQFFDVAESWSTLLRKYQFRRSGNELIDGYDCVRFDSTSEELEAANVHMSIHVAPELDFAPVRADFRLNPGGSGLITKEMRSTEHSRVGQSWIVRTAIFGTCSERADVCEMSYFEVQDVTIGPENAPVSLRSSLPDGTKVTDLVHQERWVADGQGGRRDVRPVDMNQLERASEAMASQVNRPKMKRSRDWALLGVGAGTLAMVGLLVLVRRWLGR